MYHMHVSLQTQVLFNNITLGLTQFQLCNRVAYYITGNNGHMYTYTQVHLQVLQYVCMYTDVGHIYTQLLPIYISAS